jgi:hypothetical protein
MLFKPRAARATGRYQGSCVRVARGGGDAFQCVINYIVPNGVIYGEAISSSQGPGQGVITGGTGAYASARGTFQYRATGNPRVELTLRITR